MAVFHTDKIDFFEHKVYPVGTKMPVIHFHNHHELYFLERGKVTYLIGNDLYYLEQNDFAFIPKGIYHQTDCSNHTDISRMILVFDDDFVGPEYLRYIREMSENRHIRIRPEYLPCIRKLLAFIEEESSRHQQDYRKMQKLYLQELLILISRYRQDQAKEPPQYPEIYRIIMEVAKYIADNISQELNLDVLSKKYAISSGYLSKLFKKVTGIGLNDYIMLTRITAAQKLLSKNDCRVTDVAMACGFNDSAYFSKSFKEITGVTPKKYQMQCMRNGKEQQS